MISTLPYKDNYVVKHCFSGGDEMEQTKRQQYIVFKTMYDEPQIDIIQFSCADIITASGLGDENQGEWDPQCVDDMTFLNER